MVSFVHILLVSRFAVPKDVDIILVCEEPDTWMQSPQYSAPDISFLLQMPQHYDIIMKKYIHTLVDNETRTPRSALKFKDSKVFSISLNQTFDLIFLVSLQIVCDSSYESVAESNVKFLPFRCCDDIFNICAQLEIHDK